MSKPDRLSAAECRAVIAGTYAEKPSAKWNQPVPPGAKHPGRKDVGTVLEGPDFSKLDQEDADAKAMAAYLKSRGKPGCAWLCEYVGLGVALMRCGTLISGLGANGTAVRHLCPKCQSKQNELERINRS